MDFFGSVQGYFSQLGDYFKIGTSLLMAFFMSIGQIIAPLTANRNALFDKWSTSDKFSSSYCVEMKKDPNKDFVVLNLADIQLKDKELYDDSWDFAKATIKYEITKTRPDLITLTGDNAWGMLTYIELCKEIDSYGIPWAPVMGNHDGNNTPSEFWCAYQFTQTENCLFKFGPKDMGFGNYIINITENGKIIHSLFMMDTHSNAFDTKESKINAGSDGDTSGYDHLWANQLEWYEWAVKGIKETAGKTVESSVFMHIPTVEYADYYADYYDADKDCWKPEYAGTCFGVNHEPVCSPKGNNGFFDLCKKLGSTKNIVVGHDHVNCSSMLVDGIRLSYGLKCGSGCYWEPEMNGGSTLTISSDGKAEFSHVPFNIFNLSDIMSSGLFTIKATLHSGSEEVADIPLSAFYDGEKFAIDITVSLSGLNIEMRIIYRDGQLITLIPSLRGYYITSNQDLNDLMSQYGPDEINSTLGFMFYNTSDKKHLGTETVKIYGKEYRVEKYEFQPLSGDKYIAKYYFDDNKFEKIEFEYEGEEKAMFELNELYPYADSDMFEIPAGYIDMTGIMNSRMADNSLQEAA